MRKFVGTGVALITPFKEDHSVDVEALKRLVRFQKENGINYIVVLGTTGEYATLTKEEKELVKETIVKENNGALPLVLGIGGNNTQAVTEQIKTENLKGFDAILSVSPYYVKPTQEGIYQHFKKVSQASTLPVILYNVPGRTGSNMLPATVARLANDCENIIGIKEAAGNMVQAMEMIAQTPDDFLVISGDDMITLPMVLAGGAGVISVIAEGFPKQFSEMVQLGLSREVDEAYKIHYQIAPAIDLIFAEGNPAGIKAVFKKLELAEDYVRLPLVEASKALTSKISAFVDQNKKEG
ncbi:MULTISPECIES: 4-hydroxy-tetrahydrodipicolinate synthase [Mesonia]|uniref:4-hydroxy-tetrahydrodipicolinate synthase n=1 Tax=Mesonia oceanica TaxID=2687242 RepID=A0AC61YC98_9FLAO|nr:MULTISPECIES: 4-hydroxy-tetrahydrodipicolinate synthase [Mesonia]MAN29282.1 4-hydroxy-tetrahydrodipicolinate synthase [Mesonia sp.]MAQ39894.1 4-hydroxy-tetrahydrodipicolinate synthase [Mesonia sp.]MBJ99028.1 4-hydroxy-tetrahydrodipicolinate synthase [Flavobacteriaceae bacterium]VVV02061.1 4-hydroxy-tetrahydrodipicolinate synthase [Mesonia oceanica]|tara:strand:- start:10748 stop:11635 length:888 start_codon:yes stop_codon:yes gene_type:complete